MNEILFFIQLLLIVGFALGALRLGPSALVAWVAVQALIANLFVLKQITLFGMEVTASDAFAIGSLLGLNFLQEQGGQKQARLATKICFFLMLFFVLASQVHLLYIPNLHDTSHSAFASLLSVSPRLFLASMGTFFIVQQLDIYVFTFLKKYFAHVHFAYRASFSLVLSQFLDTCLFSFIGLYGLVSSITTIILVSFLIKVIVIFCFTSLVRLTRYERFSF